MRFFSRLGPINQGLHRLLSEFFVWKKANGTLTPQGEPVFFDLMEIGTMREAEKCFYKIGVGADEARETLNAHLGPLEELARFIVAHVTSVVVGDERVLENRRFIETIDLKADSWPLETLHNRWKECASSTERWQWSFDPHVMRRFRSPRVAWRRWRSPWHARDGSVTDSRPSSSGRSRSTSPSAATRSGTWRDGSRVSYAGRITATGRHAT